LQGTPFDSPAYGGSFAIVAGLLVLVIAKAVDGEGEPQAHGSSGTHGGHVQLSHSDDDGSSPNTSQRPSRRHTKNNTSAVEIDLEIEDSDDDGLEAGELLPPPDGHPPSAIGKKASNTKNTPQDTRT
jgi:hypothetical protein